MSNKNKLTPQDDSDISGILNTEQKKFYRSCKHSDKLRRFTYTNWCPICEADTSRRRSKSESLETFDNNIFRKRVRDPTKKDASSENKSYGVGDARTILETSRLLRSNFCELPTTYITNCQTVSATTTPSTQAYPLPSVDRLANGYGSGITRLHYLSANSQMENRVSGNDHKIKESAYYHEAYKNLSPTKNFVKRMSNVRPSTPHVEEFPTPPAPPPTSKALDQFLNLKSHKKTQERLPPSPKSRAPIPPEAYLLPVRPKTCTPEQMRSDNYNKFKSDILRPKETIAKNKSDSVVANDKQVKSCYVIECQANRKILQTPVEMAQEKLPDKFVKVPSPKLHKMNKSPVKMKRPVEGQAETTTTLPPTPLPPSPPTPRSTEKFETIKKPQTAPADSGDGKRNRVRLRSDSDNSVGVPDKPELTKKAREVSPPQPETTAPPIPPATPTPVPAPPIPLIPTAPILVPEPVPPPVDEQSPPTSPTPNNINNPVPKKELKAKSAVKLASIKNRHKISVTKLRKVRNKIAHSISSDSNLSDSDFEDTETDENFGHLAEEPKFEISGSTPTHQICQDFEVSSQYENWPLRSSLFAHVPPYVRFASHDAENVKMPRNAHKYFKWRLSNITPIVVRKTLSNTGFRLVRSEYSRDSNDWTGTWGKHIKSVVFQTLKETQKLNHFPGTFQIGRKDRLWKNLQRLMFKFGMKEFGFIPRTFVLPHDLKLLRQAWEKTGMDKWIIKPPASARGTGIRVIHRWAHLPKKKSLVVQQYISNPYLINGSKFDLRLYVLVTSFNPLRVYLYPEGLARFASTKYSDDVSTLSDRYMHLTNYSINKLSSHYAANEDANACKGHKWTLSKLWEYLEKDGVNTRSLWRSLQQLVIKTMLCGESSITQLYKQHVNSRYNCYELFGVDVLLDERLKPWLLEVNISPSLHSASPLDLHVKGPLVQSLLNLAQFHLSPKMARVNNSPPVLDSNLYTMQLTTHERLKHLHFIEFERRDEYLSDILRDLTGDDVRHLLTAEDELTVIGNFERIFPTQHTHTYFQFMEPRYYNRLFDAWENRYEKNRTPGIKILQNLCEKKVHLDVPPISTKKSSDEESTTVSTTSEVTSSSEDVSKPQTPQPPVVIQRPQTSPIPVLVDPTIKALRNEIRYKLMNLSLGMGLSPF